VDSWCRAGAVVAGEGYFAGSLLRCMDSQSGKLDRESARAVGGS